MKRRLGGLFLFSLLCLVCVGFARGWFAVSRPKEVDHKVNVELTISPEKMKDDARKVGEKVNEISNEVIDKVQK